MEKYNILAIADPSAGKLPKTVAIRQRPRNIILSEVQHSLYIADTIQVLNIDSLKPLGILPSGEAPGVEPEPVAVSLDKKWVASASGQSMWCTGLMKVTKSIALGRYLWGFKVK